MKRLITFIAMFALLSVTDFAFAQRSDKGNDKQGQGQQQDQRERRGGNDGQKGGGRGSRGGQGQKGGGQGGGRLFRLLDIDRDGNLSAKEIDGAVAALMKLDVNRDGILDAQELVVRGGGQRRKGGRVGQQGAGSSQRGGGQGKGGQGNRSVNSNGKSE